MKTKWLNRQGNKQCILFFNGWGMDELAISHLEMSGFDVCMCYDYTTVQPLKEDFSSYQKIVVVAWSLGVWAAAEVLSKSKIKIVKSIALNGTMQPVDLSYGIDPSVFEKTQLNWNISNRERFNRRMLGGKFESDLNQKTLSNRGVEEQKNELKSILRNVSKKNQLDFNFDSVLIGQKDLIFNPSNQWQFWKRKAAITEEVIPHYPFNYLISWEQIIRL